MKSPSIPTVMNIKKQGSSGTIPPVSSTSTRKLMAAVVVWLSSFQSPAYYAEAFQQRMMPPTTVHPAAKINDRRTLVFQRTEPYHFPTTAAAESSALHVSFGSTPPPDESPEQKDSNKQPFSLQLATPLGALAILAFVVLFHETGHYWMAKSIGVPVDEFSLGFGPKIASLGGDDTFSWRALPLGGYVSINRASMAALPWFLQVQILSAGVFFNLLLAWIIYTAQIWKGDGLPVPAFESGIVVGGLVETTTTDRTTTNNKSVASSSRPPAKGLLQPGDIIHAVNGKTVLARPTASEMEVNRAIDKLLAEIQATPDGQSVIFTVVDPKASGQQRQVKNVQIQPRRIVSSSMIQKKMFSRSHPLASIFCPTLSEWTCSRPTIHWKQLPWVPVKWLCSPKKQPLGLGPLPRTIYRARLPTTASKDPWGLWSAPRRLSRPKTGTPF